jgi:outer membrane protein OmpA-like peptidoglycan-associated protein
MLTPQLLGSLAAKTGVPEPKVRAGMDTSVRAITDGLAGKARDTRAMGDVVDLVDRTPDIDDPTYLLDDDSSIQRNGEQLLGRVSDTTSLSKRIGDTHGFGAGAANTMLGAAAGLVLVGLKKLARARGGLDASTLSTALLEGRPKLRTDVPAIGSTPAARWSDSEPRHEHVVTHTKSRRPWWLLALVPLALLAFWLFNRARHREPDKVTEVQEQVYTPQREQVDEPAPVPAPPQEEQAVPPQTATPEPMEPQTAEPPATEPATPDEETAQTTPDEEPMTPDESTAALDLPADSAEAKLQSQAAQPSVEITWITLDNVKFDTGKSEVPDEGKEQVSNVAKVMEQNPKAKIEIGGFTSGPGSEELNQRLSQERADAVRQELIDQGVDADRIVAKGYGEEQPAEQTSDEVQANRRVAARVTERDEG